MIRSLPRWVWISAWLLASFAGLINVIGFLSFSQEAITHLTGTTSLLTMALVFNNHALALNSAAIILAYLLGTFISGLITLDKSLELGRRYGAVLMLESLLLVAAAMALNQNLAAGLWLAACACGLQNAMSTTYSGAVIRTTHLTGMLTDLGIFLGQALRGLKMEYRRLGMSANVISGFFVGGLVGAFSFLYWGYFALLIPASITGLTGFLYMLWTLKHPQRSLPK